MATGKPPKYQPLRAYLAAVPAGVQTVTLTLADIAAIIGAPLPPSAGQQHWWVNVRHSSQARAWLDAGWRVARVDRLGQAVTFTRAAATREPAVRSG